MEIFFMFGKYSEDALKKISARRTEQASDIIKEVGGEYQSAYALLGEYDIVIIATFPGTQEAMRASLGLHKLTGIAFTTAPAVEVGDFDKIAATL